MPKLNRIYCRVVSGADATELQDNVEAFFAEFPQSELVAVVPANTAAWAVVVLYTE